MIESRFWREEMRKQVRWLRTKRRYKRWSEKQLVLYERMLMVVAFQVRTLLERPKVSFEVAGRPISCVMYKMIGKEPPNLFNHADLPSHFDVDNPKPIELKPVDVCNQLIHHYLMMLTSERTAFATVLVYSDYKRKVCLYEIEVEALIDCFGRVASEDSHLRGAKLGWSEKRMDYEFLAP